MIGFAQQQHAAVANLHFINVDAWQMRFDGSFIAHGEPAPAAPPRFIKDKTDSDAGQYWTCRHLREGRCRTP
jgi:hypothetical protein